MTLLLNVINTALKLSQFALAAQRITTEATAEELSQYSLMEAEIKAASASIAEAKKETPDHYSLNLAPVKLRARLHIAAEPVVSYVPRAEAARSWAPPTV